MGTKANKGQDMSNGKSVELRDELESFGEFLPRHIGPTEAEVESMLETVGGKSLDGFIESVVPAGLRVKAPLSLSAFPVALSEGEAIARLRGIAAKNTVLRSLIGMGYYDTITPPVIQRNILENPGWYTQYTPYQPEISQGRLEALLNFQTMISDLTGMEIANASLLDEATAAAEAMGMSVAIASASNVGGRLRYLVSNSCHPQTIDVVKNRAATLGVEVTVSDPQTFEFSEGTVGVLLQYPDTFGVVSEYKEVIEKAKAAKALVAVATDLLALALLKTPAELGADIAVGSAQRFGVPLGYGGPHAAFFATRESYKRLLPGRLIGVSKDSYGRPALRLALQTREQHIRREKATSNICTAQVLLAIMASMYAVYHGPKGIKRIAERVHRRTAELAGGLRALGYTLRSAQFFDTLTVQCASSKEADSLHADAVAAGYNLRATGDALVGISFDEKTTVSEVERLLEIFAGARAKKAPARPEVSKVALPARASEYLTHAVFGSYHTETEFLRYVRKLESRDLSLGTAMIPLGSCTMKLNATSEMLPVTWSEFGGIHPFAPKEQAAGYHELFRDLERALAEITGFDGVSLQPNSGAQGEYAGLLAIRAYHLSRGDTGRTVCLIPKSAHGTNAASAAMAGMQVVVVECDERGNVDVADLERKVQEHGSRVSNLMVTYPSTHGVFESEVRKICDLVHSVGGQVYMDGANLNALVGLCKPADFGADVSHINLHKTFCIPHGGGGPGMGPIGVRKHLAPFLPGHPVVNLGHEGGVGAVSAAPWGSASILVIPWMYLAMMGGEGLTRATKLAILNANYIATRVSNAFPILYRGQNDRVAHECIVDLRPLKKSAAVEVDDIAKRLMDFGFHPPTMSFPVAGTIMVEPTESESKYELDRFCDALLAIREEVAAIERGEVAVADSVVRHAPHTQRDIVNSEWTRPYSREAAVFPTRHVREAKFWPAVNRIDHGFGDRNLVCSCPPIGEL